MKTYILLILLIPTFTFSQIHPIKIFEPLVGYSWSAEGTWGDGSTFKQEITYEFSLNGKLVISKSKGFIDKEQTIYGLRNHGIRQFDAKKGKIRFWEFDIFDNVTEGTVEKNGRNFIYTYDYDGNIVTEMWIYKDEVTYGFIVGVYSDGEWQQKFLETQFKGQKFKPDR